MTLYEILTGSVAWSVEIKTPSDVLDKDSHYMSELGRRVLNCECPKLPDYVPDAWRNLIESCWNSDASLRPAMSDIVEMFGNHLQDFVTGRLSDANVNEIRNYIDDMRRQE